MANSSEVHRFDLLISSEQLYKIQILNFWILWPVTILFGLLANVINISVFSLMGLKDSVSISFLVLSMLDFAFLLSASLLATCSTIAWATTGQILPISYYSISGYAYWYQSMFQEMSMGVTTYIAVTRCCCIAMALKFKTTFTVKRTVAVLMLICCVCVSSRIPTLTSTGLAWQWSSRLNMSRFIVWFGEEFNTFKAFNDVFNKTVYATTVLIIVFVCSLVLTHTLIRASVFRSSIVSIQNHSDFCTSCQRNDSCGKGGTLQKNDSHSESEGICGDKCTGMNRSYQSKAEINAGNDECINVPEVKQNSTEEPLTLAKSSSLSAKELGVVRSVTVVTACLLGSVLFKCMIALTEVVIPEFMSGGEYAYLYSVTHGITHTVDYLNADINILVYFKFNTKFRHTFLRTFWT